MADVLRSGTRACGSHPGGQCPHVAVVGPAAAAEHRQAEVFVDLHISAAKRWGSSPSRWSSRTRSWVLKGEALALNPSNRRPTSPEVPASSRRALETTEGW